MSKKPTKESITAATIEEQTAAFLKSGGTVQYVVKGTTGQVLPTAAKQTSNKGS